MPSLYVWKECQISKEALDQVRSQWRISLTDWRHIFGYRPMQPRDISTSTCYKTSFSMVITIRNLNGDRHQKSASSSTLMDQAAYLELPSVSFCPPFQSCNLMWLTMTTFILKPCLKHNEIVFPVGKNCPRMESVAAPLNICFQRKQKQFSNFHQTPHIRNMTSPGSTIPFALWRLNLESCRLWNEPNIRFCSKAKVGVLKFLAANSWHQKQVHLQFLSNFSSGSQD